MNSKIDLHMHSCASDGTDMPQVLLEKLKKQQITTFALTDHDTIEGSLMMEKLLKSDESDLVFLRGVELSCRYERHKCHILGYGFDASDEVFLSFLSEGKKLRDEKLLARLAFLREHFGISFTGEELSWLYSLPCAGKPHLAKLLIGKGYAPDMDRAIKKYINQAPGGDVRQDAVRALEVIGKAKGISVWAHPLGGEGEKRVDRETFLYYLDLFVSKGLKGLECFYSRYERDEVEFLKAAAQQRGLLISGGSDYHGSVKNISLGTLNAEDIPVESKELTLLHAFMKE